MLSGVELLTGVVPLFESCVDPEGLNIVLKDVSQPLSTVSVSRDIDPSGSTISIGMCLRLSWPTLIRPSYFLPKLFTVCLFQIVNSLYIVSPMLASDQFSPSTSSRHLACSACVIVD
jgi:hypothetical protein